MKTKRMKKLLMSMGVSRNQANRFVAIQRECGNKNVSNALYYLLVSQTIRECEPELLPLIDSIVLS